MSFRNVLIAIVVTSCVSFGCPLVELSADDATPARQAWDAGFAQPGADGSVNQLAVVTAGPEKGVYFGGEFKHIGGNYFAGLARFDGTQWHQVGDGCPCNVTALLVDSEVQPPVVYVAGKAHVSGKTIIAEYRNGNWRTLANSVVGLGQQILAMTIHPSKERRLLVVGGSFTEVRGSEPIRKLPPETAMGVAAWDGSSWSAIGKGLQGDVRINGFGGFGGTATTGPHAVRALLSVVESGHAVLYAGGNFTRSDNVRLQGLARWDGSNCARRKESREE